MTIHLAWWALPLLIFVVGTIASIWWTLSQDDGWFDFSPGCMGWLATCVVALLVALWMIP